MRPTIEWKQGRVIMIDQRKLPLVETWLECKTPEAAAAAIAGGYLVLNPQRAEPDLDLALIPGIPLLDTPSDEALGGTGRVFDWRLAETLHGRFVLAGGLGPDNVAAAFIDNTATVSSNELGDQSDDEAGRGQQAPDNQPGNITALGPDRFAGQHRVRAQRAAEHPNQRDPPHVGVRHGLHDLGSEPAVGIACDGICR